MRIFNFICIDTEPITGLSYDFIIDGDDGKYCITENTNRFLINISTEY